MSVVVRSPKEPRNKTGRVKTIEKEKIGGHYPIRYIYLTSVWNTFEFAHSVVAIKALQNEKTTEKMEGKKNYI